MPTDVMTAHNLSDQRAARLRWIPPAASASAVLAGSLVLIGWWFDVAFLKRLWVGIHTVKANTALAFILTGVALGLSQTESTSGWSRRAARICASIVVLLSLLTLSEYLLGWELGIDQLLVRDLDAPGGPHHIPGHMAFATALNFLLLGVILLLDGQTHGGDQIAPVLAIIVAGSAFLTLVAYLYTGSALHHLYPLATLDTPAAALFLALAVAVLFTCKQHRFMELMASKMLSAVAMRRLLLLSILLPVFLGWIRLMGQRFGLYGTELGLALMVTLAVAGLIGSIYWQATSLIQAEEYQRGINEVSVAFSGTTTLEDTFPIFATTVQKIAAYDRICVVARDGEKLVALASFAASPLQCFLGKAWQPSGETAVEWVMAHKTPRLVRDLSLEQRFADEAFVAREGIRSTLILPLLVGGEAVGSMTLDSRTPGAYTQDHVALLSGFTEPLAAAVRNAELHAEVVRYTQELEYLVEVRTRELQTANGHLAEASRHKSVFLANMSHELRTPLNAILGFAELLHEQIDGSLTPKQVRYANHIHASGTHLLALINDLLDLSKVEAGKLTLCPEPFALSEALAAALQEIQPLADPKQLTLTLDVETALITLTADPVRFKQIVYNLLSNAVKFTPEGGRIAVAARRVATSGAQAPHGEWVEIAVADTGIGIAAEDLSRLFERFSQIETATTKQLQGSGLGLVLTKQLVELHGGTIAVASAGHGQGSTFTVRLPLAPTESPE